MKSISRVVLLVFAVIVSLLVIGCSEAGSDGGSGSGVEQDFEDVSLDALGLIYYGEGVPSSYNTDVIIMSSSAAIDVFFDETGSVSDAVFIYFWLNDSSDSLDIDVGTYTLDPTSEAAGVLTAAAIWTGLDASDGAPTAIDSAADSDYESASGFADDYEFSPGSFVQITSGTVEVSKSGSEYSFTWSLTTADGYTIDGSYAGVPTRSVDDSI